MIELATAYYNRTLRATDTRQLSSTQYENRNLEIEQIQSHLKWMCLEIMQGRVSGSKAARWIGYIQGELRAMGIFNISQLRYQSLGTEYVVGFLLHGEEVALVRKAKPAWQAGKLNGIGGKVENDETILEAMIREFQEETQVEVKDWEHFATLHTKGDRVHFFRAEATERHELKGLPEEPVDWYGPTNEDKIPNLNWLIPAARLQRGITEVWE